jgi:hypothetical protein
VAEQSSERAERRVWTPEVVDEQTVTIRTLGPGQDAAATELGGELLQIAEKALNDRSAAERIVTTILQTQGDLVTTAVRALTPDQRQAARDGLARAVRRAALDALPPVVPPPTTDSVPRRAAPATGATPKRRPVQARTTMAGSTAGEDPAGEPPAAVPAKVAAGGNRKRAVGIVIGLGLMLAGGFAFWEPLLRPTADETASALEPARAAPLAPVASPAEAEPLQLEADEPPSGLLRQPGQAAPPTETAAGAEAEADAAMAEGESSTATASPPFRPIDMTAEAVREPAASPAGLALPAGGGNLRIFILYPAGGPAVSQASALYADLSRTGDLPLVVLREVGFAIASPRIRYFHAADAEAAGALAAFLDPPRGAWQVQNFGHLSPLPALGTVEIYVPPA